MESAILWFGFIGAWLLFAGPIYQAALELMDQDIEIDRIKSARDTVIAPPKVSALWWFIPPIKLYLEHRRSSQYKRRHLETLSPEDLEALIAFTNKATGWFMVAAGGLCIAIKETYELCHAHDYSSKAIWIIVAVMSFMSVLYTVVRITRGNKLLLVQKDMAKEKR